MNKGDRHVFRPGAIAGRRPAVPRRIPYLFSADDFYRMIDLEIFPDEARVGLWDGRIYEKMAKTHGSCRRRDQGQRRPCSGSCRRAGSLWAENPITISPDKAPLPDLVVLRGAR